MYAGLNYIDGDFKRLTNDFSSYNPSTEEEIGIFPESNTDTINEAVAVAKKTQKKWRTISKPHRAEFFDKLCMVMKDKETSAKFAKAISKETGKSLNESLAEYNEALHMAQYVFGRGRMPSGVTIPSEIIEKDASIIRKPKGVVAVISAWNFPFAIGGFWWAAPAILEGNTVVFKPSEETPMIGQMTAELYHKAGFPPGVFNLIHGSGKVGAALVQHKDINHICFTGSAEAGKSVRKTCADSWDKTCSCEMGGKSAVIVCEDANLEMAVNACFASAYRLSGQRCVSAGRMLVHRNIFDKFVESFVKKSSEVKIGNPLVDQDIDFGPLVNRRQMLKVMNYNDLSSKDESVKVLLEGARCFDSGYFLSPHVYTTEWKMSETRPFLIEEVFGPHVAIVPFNDVQEAVDIYNDTEYGLSLSVITNDYVKMRKFRDECDFGLGYVNLPCIGAESHLPFGGVKKSGNGWSSAAGTFDSVTHEVTWTVNHQNDGYKMAQGLKS